MRMNYSDLQTEYMTYLNLLGIGGTNMPMYYFYLHPSRDAKLIEQLKGGGENYIHDLIAHDVQSRDIAKDSNELHITISITGKPSVSPSEYSGS